MEGVKLGKSGSMLVPDEAEQVRSLRAWYRQKWESRGEIESTFHQFYRLIKPAWGVDRSVLVPDKKLRIILARFRAGCYLLKAGSRHGHQHRMEVDRACPCCREGDETVAHFFFHCRAYAQERVRFGLHRFFGTRTELTSIRRLFCDKRSRLETLARFISLAWRIRDRYLRGEDFLNLWDSS